MKNVTRHLLALNPRLFKTKKQRKKKKTKKKEKKKNSNKANKYTFYLRKQKKIKIATNNINYASVAYILQPETDRQKRISYVRYIHNQISFIH